MYITQKEQHLRWKLNNYSFGPEYEKHRILKNSDFKIKGGAGCKTF